ncbi:CBS domain-containing protein [Vibrio ulleungensis]|jgi:CBS domain-containing protein|uniref:CBS domain-containing protein n=1 Tax=Vibrio ulleungensis TaxID=2807619 RepID=A0ABS2HJU3_9VIBR|nr:CBS domain-containing protein [Vibrio ulleungensis]MBM7036787.1 CBS domain-containing protein [Vibrio ulleungensis]
MHSIKVKEYMDPQAVTFTKTMSLTAALDKVIKSGRMGGPVINEHREVIGFISEQDLLERLVKVLYHSQDTHIVDDCMYRDVLTVSPELPILELAQMMKVNKPKVYPVVDNGKLVGIISRADVMKAVSNMLDEVFSHPV